MKWVIGGLGGVSGRFGCAFIFVSGFPNYVKLSRGFFVFKISVHSPSRVA